MSTEPVTDEDAERKKARYHFDRHTPEYREQFADVKAVWDTSTGRRPVFLGPRVYGIQVALAATEPN